NWDSDTFEFDEVLTEFASQKRVYEVVAKPVVEGLTVYVLPPPYPATAGLVSGRVRVAVRLRPRNSEELTTDADFADCVELQPELKRLKLRRNNWDSDTFEFDEVLTEFASQKRVYEVVA
nr:kinesin-like protein KIN-UB [Tanacetum cinerariifolium]